MTGQIQNSLTFYIQIELQQFSVQSYIVIDRGSG